MFFQNRMNTPFVMKSKIQELFNNIMNILIKDEYRTMPIKEKLNLPLRNKERWGIDIVSINEKFLKSAEDFSNNLRSIYKVQIEWNKFIFTNKKSDIMQVMIHFLSRICWKISQLFPFSEEFNDKLKCIYPETFNYDFRFYANNLDIIITSQNFPIFQTE